MTSSINVCVKGERDRPTKQLGEIEVRTAFLARRPHLGDEPRELFLRIFERVVSLEDPNSTFDRNNNEFTDYEEVDLEIIVKRRRDC